MTTVSSPRSLVISAVLALLLVSAGCTDTSRYFEKETFTPTPTPEPTPVAHERDHPGDASLYVPEDRVRDDAPWTALEIERAIEEKINERRVEHGFEPLVVDPRFRTGPRNWSYWMDQRDDTGHRWEDNPKSGFGVRLDADGYNCRGINEIATMWVNAYDETVDELAGIFVDRWMESSGHRDALLSSHAGETIAAGIYADGDEDIWATVWLC